MTGIRALVTGASGFAGRHLCRRLAEGGTDVTGTYRQNTPELDGIRLERLDLTDASAVRRLVVEVQPHLVFHLAAIVDTVETPDRVVLFETNTMGTVSILEALRRVPTVERVLLASSSFAYGRTPPGPVPETALLRPQTSYGASKAAMEMIGLQWARETGTDVVVGRAFQHTGPGHVGAYAMSEWAARLASGAERLEVGNLDVVRDYLDVRDVVAAYCALIERGRPGESYNVGSGVPRSMRSMLEKLISAFDREVTVDTDPRRQRAVDQPEFVASIDKITRHTGWTPTIPIEATLEDLAQWWRDRVTSGGT